MDTLRPISRLKRSASALHCSAFAFSASNSSRGTIPANVPCNIDNSCSTSLGTMPFSLRARSFFSASTRAISDCDISNSSTGTMLEIVCCSRLTISVLSSQAAWASSSLDFGTSSALRILSAPKASRSSSVSVFLSSTHFCKNSTFSDRSALIFDKRTLLDSKLSIHTPSSAYFCSCNSDTFHIYSRIIDNSKMRLSISSCCR